MAYLEDRDRMVEQQVRARGILDRAVLEALRKVPRHCFVPELDHLNAYEDRPLPIGGGQTISQPYMVALMTSLLALTPGDRVLEIGTGCGYQTAVLAELGAEVYSVERVEALSRRARALLEELGYAGVTFRVGDGTSGWPEHAPYQAVIVTAGGPAVPPCLIEQLGEGGRLVMPVGSSRVQRLVRLTRRGKRLRREEHGTCSFVKLIGQHGWNETPR